MSSASVEWYEFPLDPATHTACETGINHKQRLTPDCQDRIHQPSKFLASACLQVSNPNVPLPKQGLYVLSDFVSQREVDLLQKELSNDSRYQNDSTWEGFDGPRRRVCAYSFHPQHEQKQYHKIPNTLVTLQQRLLTFTGLCATYVKLEEYIPARHSKAGLAYDPHVLSSFLVGPEIAKQNSYTCQKTQQEMCCTQENGEIMETNIFASNALALQNSYFLAEIPLVFTNTGKAKYSVDSQDEDIVLLQNWNQPASRCSVSWYLRSDQHWTDVRLQPNTAIVKQFDLLTNWRSTRVLTTSNPNAAINVLVLKFYHLPPIVTVTPELSLCEDNSNVFGYVPTYQDVIKRKQRLHEPMPPLADLLTIIITTSPIKSNPSTEVLERAMETFLLAGSDFAFECRKIIVCDGFRIQDDEICHDESFNGTKIRPEVSRKHGNAKQAMRNGIVNREQAENYRQYKRNLQHLCTRAHFGDTPNVFRNATVIELDERHGYGFALRHALRHCVETPLVCVIQHDRTFMRPTPVRETVRAMWLHSHVKYVGFTMRSNLIYRDIFLARYGSGLGRQHQQEWMDMLLHLPELCVPKSEYGPDSASVQAMTFTSDKARHNAKALIESYKGSQHAATASLSNAVPSGRHQMTLIPTLFWYDNVHICDTQHYRDFIFHESYKMVARGGFVEDKLSPVIKRTVERLGLKEGHSRFGSYLLDDHSGMFFTGHLDGGSFATEEQRRALIASQQEKII